MKQETRTVIVLAAFPVCPSCGGVLNPEGEVVTCPDCDIAFLEEAIVVRMVPVGIAVIHVPGGEMNEQE